MFENVGKFEVSMHYLRFYQDFKCIEYLQQEFYSFFLSQYLLCLYILREISFITIFKNQIKIIAGFLNIIEFYY